MRTGLAMAGVLVAQVAFAQAPAGMGAAQDMGARPLMVDELPVGTVTVRVGRGSLANSAVGVEVVATLTGADGKASTRTETTKADGRATFSGLPVGANFRAITVVDGQSLQTTPFVIPDDSGVRLMLVSTGNPGDEASDDAADDTRPANPHGTGPMAVPSIGALVGKIEPKDGLAAGTLELRLVDADSAALAGQEVKLGRAAKAAMGMAWVNGTTDKDGTVRFQKLETGDAQQYLAVIDRNDMRMGSERFQLPTDKGGAGELRVPGRTSDTSVLQVSSASKVLLDLREESLEVMENLVMENTSNQIFQATPSGLAIPLPAEANNVGAIEGGSRVQVSEAKTLFLREAIAPASPDQVPVQARFGFFMPLGGGNSLTFRQPMPLGIASPVVMLPESAHLTLSGSGLQALAPRPDDHGGQMLIFQLPSVPRNGVLVFTVSGLPTRGGLGQTIAGVLAGALFLAAALGLRRPKPRPAAAQWASQRKKRMDELVEVERARQAAGHEDASLDGKRAELLAAIEALDNKLAGDAGGST